MQSYFNFKYKEMGFYEVILKIKYQKFGVGKIFLKEASFAQQRQHLLDQKCSNIAEYYYNSKLLFSISVYFKM